MTTIAIIGAGGYIFPLELCRDLLSFHSVHGAELRMMDLSLERAERNACAVRQLAAMHGIPITVMATTDRRAALEGARFVILAWQVGGLSAYTTDIEIPLQYGIDQPVGDTLGPGGIFRGLRTVQALEGFAADYHALCPDALVLQYANPMAMNCLALEKLGVNAVGLCHSVQGTSKMIAETIGVPYSAFRYKVAGINHQAWFLEATRLDEGGRAVDLLPLIRDTFEHLAFLERRSPEEDARLGERRECVRTEIMRLTGYFQTESGHHASEYLPWFRHTPEQVLAYLPSRWDYYRDCLSRADVDQTADFLERNRGNLEPGEEYGAYIVDSLLTNTPRVINGNVANVGLIDNLPAGACVEVPCLVDGSGVQPTTVGALPAICAAVNRTNINVQELTVKAALERDRDALIAALALDPLTSVHCTLPQVRELAARMLEAHRVWIEMA
jgi:alpha-galactosidase